MTGVPDDDSPASVTPTPKIQILKSQHIIHATREGIRMTLED
jgi:hypothetical protein